MSTKELIEYIPRITEEAYRIGKKNGISRQMVHQRWYQYEWAIERAITEPLKKTDSSVWDEWKETCKANGVSNECFNRRVKIQGMTPEEAATMPKKWKKGEVK